MTSLHYLELMYVFVLNRNGLSE